MTLLINIWQILTKAPQIIGIIKAIIDVIGSKQVQKVLEAIRDAMNIESPMVGSCQTEPERERLARRILRRLGEKKEETDVKN